MNCQLWSEIKSRIIEQTWVSIFLIKTCPVVRGNLTNGRWRDLLISCTQVVVEEISESFWQFDCCNSLLDYGFKR